MISKKELLQVQQRALDFFDKAGIVLTLQEKSRIEVADFGLGDLDHTLTIACLECSKTARKKIESSGSQLISIEELLEKNPKGSGVKIFY